MIEGISAQFQLFDALPPSQAPARPIEPIHDDDLPGCRALVSAILLRAIHDACGVFVSRVSDNEKLATARAAWTWLHDDENTINGQARAMLVEITGFEPSDFDKQIITAEIPWPTRETMALSTLELEKVYWRLAGKPGPEPVAGPFKGEKRKRATTRAGRKENRSFIMSARRFLGGAKQAQAAL